MALTIPPAFCTDQPYPFSILRKQMASLTSAGIVHAGDMSVSPASGLQVQIAAGEAYVQQTGATEGSEYNGLYYELNDAPANPFNTISAPLSNPRIDFVILRVYDVTELGISGSSFARYEWVQGSENASASLTTMGPGLSNPGAPTLPASSLLRAYVLQPVGESSISSGNVLNIDTLAGSGPIRTPRVFAASGMANSGDAILAGANETVTLPAPFPGALVCVQANETVSGVSPVTVTYGSGGGKNFGKGLGPTGAASFPLGFPESFTSMYSYDGTNYRIISGEQDTGWVSQSVRSGWTVVTPVFIRLMGDRVYMRGFATGPDNNPLSLLSAQYRPTATVNSVVAATGGPVNFIVNTSGNSDLSSTPGSAGFDDTTWSIS